ncbi:hypothetical protein HHL16_18885 [Pseudoflavitalea sp. G-6-1-2]|uniref:FixH family protein n=1 Tax=Pseudoflavitalea sp. G-6-1-2 TaxID=2728841 RepID=UPI00146F8D2E|nr:FixH family protein [Pseudoflavitalea sp. G-6-1-2]NML22950.1 hypothetical protein [Pseudoflavitalea sp. G-6-1-2]
MTFNWGHKLTIFICAFAGMILLLVYKCTQTNFDLVTKEYYKDELVYQQVIDGTNLANRLSSKATVSQDDSNITIQFPQEMKGKSLSGTAWFYCPADARRDKKITLSVNEDALQQLSKQQFLPGRYTVKLSWNADGKQYYSESSIEL